MSLNKKPDSHVFNLGNLPEGKLGLSWIETPELTPEHTVVENFGNLTQESTNEVLVRLYHADIDGTLKYSEPIETKELVLTDRVYEGKPLFYKSYSRFYHKDYNKYIDGAIYNGPSIKVLDLNLRTYPHAYRISLRVPTAYSGSGIVSTEIPYDIEVETELGDPFVLTYNKCDALMNNTELGFSEYCYPVPIFNEEDRLSYVSPSGIDNYFVEALQPNQFGYKVHVNSTALKDNRYYQVFKWRVAGSAAGTSIITTSEPTGVTWPSGVVPTGIIDPPVPTATDSVDPREIKIYRTCWLDQYMQASREALLYSFEWLSRNTNEYINFMNPFASSGLVKTDIDYFRENLTELQSLTEAELDQYDVIIIPIHLGQLKFNQKIDKWSKKRNKALIILAAPGVTFDSHWRISSSQINSDINGVLYSPTGMSLRKNSNLPISEYNLIKSVNGIPFYGITASGTSSSYETISSIGSSPVAILEKGIKYISTIGEDSLILGRFDSSGNADVTSINGWPAWMNSSVNGVTDISNFTSLQLGNIQRDAGNRVLSAIKTLVNSNNSIVSDTIQTVAPKQTIGDALSLERFSTPWVSSWIIGLSSLTKEEINADPTLVKDGSILKRRLCSSKIKDYARSWFMSQHGSAYKDWTFTNLSVEIDNSNVHPVSGMTDESIPWVYTDLYGGQPFIEGQGYPNGWKLIEPGYNRFYERSDIDVPSWSYIKHSEQIPKENKIWDPQETRQVTYDVYIPGTTTTTPGTTTTGPSTSTEIARTAAWKIGASSSSVKSKIEYQVGGTRSTGYSNTTTSIANQENIASISCKSFDVETIKSQAFAWQYLPNGDGLLKSGSSGPKVSYWQDLLNKVGYGSITVDGAYGPKTAAAVLRFQNDHDEILSDSVIGPETASRITYVAQENADEWYDWASSWNLLPDRPGRYGRRTNPYDQIYYHGSLTDYVAITMKSVKDISGIELAGASLGNKGCKITRVTAFDSTNGGTRVVDLQTGWQLYAAPLKIDFGGIKSIGQIYVHIEQTNPHAYIVTDGNTYKSYHWGLQYIDIFSNTSLPMNEDCAFSGSVNLSPNESIDVDLIYKGTTDVEIWKTSSITSGPGTIAWKNGSNHFTITITSTDTSSAAPVWGSEQSDLVKPSDGTKTRDVSLSFDSATPGIITSLLLQPTTNNHSSVTVGFYNIQTSSFIGTSIEKTFYDSNVSSIKVGYKGGSSSTSPGVTTTIPGTTTTTPGTTETRTRTEIVHEGHWDTEIYYETRFFDVLENDGMVINILSPVPPLIKMALKPYWVQFFNGRRHLRLVKPYSNLASTDPWYPRISFASWNQKVKFPSSYLSGWQKDYPDANIVAYYRVPEEDFYLERYRKRFVSEDTDIYGMAELELKRSPMFVGETTDYAMDINILINNVAVPSGNIKKIDNKGIVYLSVSTESATSVVSTYSIREHEREIRGLNLNPHPGHFVTVDGNQFSGWELIGLPIYIYLLPKYCTENNSMISDSIETDVLRWTLDKRIFERDNGRFNPLAFLVGVAYMTMPFDYEDVILLDARNRGGGDEESELNNLWDLDYFNDKTYLEAGVIVIEIPEADRTKEDLIIKAINNNIAFGTLYKIRYV